MRVIGRWNARAPIPLPCSTCNRLPVLAWIADQAPHVDAGPGVQAACGCGTSVWFYKQEIRLEIDRTRPNVFRGALERWNAMHTPMTARNLAAKLEHSLAEIYELSENTLADRKIYQLRTRLKRFAAGKLEDFT